MDFVHHHIIGPHGEPTDDGVWFRLAQTGPRMPCFDSRKDVVIPTPNVHFPRTPFAPPLPERVALDGARPYLVFYAGWNFDARMKLVNTFGGDRDMYVRRCDCA